MKTNSIWKHGLAIAAAAAILILSGCESVSQTNSTAPITTARETASIAETSENIPVSSAQETSENLISSLPVTEPTEPAAEELLHLVKLENGNYEIQGPAGSVEAMQYTGIPEQDAICADLDIDGNSELVYLFDGPSSDPHTVGIAIYGLDNGMPVPKASTVLVLNGYQPRLETDEHSETVWVVLDPTFPTSEEAESKWFLLQYEGFVQLAGALLPDGCRRYELPQPTKGEIAEQKIQPTGEAFTRLCINARKFFSNGRSMIWQNGDEILKKDLSNGKAETLFVLEHNDEIETLLIGVSDNRLYFGWNEVEDWWGENVYSVNYQNGGRTDIANAQAYSFANGLLVLETFRSDVQPFTLQVFDSSDCKVADYNFCWHATFVDGSLYFIYMPELQKYSKLEAMPEEFRNVDVTLSYTVCRVDPDGSVTELGTIQQNYPNGWNANSSWIDSEGIIGIGNSVGEADYYDLFTLESIKDTANADRELAYDVELPLSELVPDELALSRYCGPHVDAIKNDEDAIIFYTYLGLFAFDAESGDPLFFVDFDKAFNRGGDMTIVGEGDHGVSCTMNEYGDTVVLIFTPSVDADPEYCLINWKTARTYMRLHTLGDYALAERGDVEMTCGCMGEAHSDIWILRKGEHWYPFREAEGND